MLKVQVHIQIIAGTRSRVGQNSNYISAVTTYLLEIEPIVEEVLHKRGVVLVVLRVAALLLLRVTALLALRDHFTHLVVEDLVYAAQRRHL